MYSPKLTSAVQGPVYLVIHWVVIRNGFYGSVTVIRWLSVILLKVPIQCIGIYSSIALTH